MAVTVTTAAERDRRHAHRAALRPSAGDAVLAAVALAAAITIAVTASGRLAATNAAPGGAAPVNLNTMVDAAALEGALGQVFASSADRRFAAAALFGFVVQGDGGRRALPNVGALARATVDLAAVEREGRLEVFRERAAARRGAPGDTAQSMPVLTASQLAELKPYVVVRERGSVVAALVLWTAAYLAAFTIPLLAWRAARRGGDVPLLSAVCLLTALGFAAMIARPDPYRDLLLFPRYAALIIAGAVIMTAASFVDMRRAVFRHLSYLPLLGALALCVLLIAFGSGPSGSSAKVNLGPVQPIEGIRLLMALFLAGYFARRWELLRASVPQTIRGVALPGWIRAPRLAYVLPLVVGIAAALALFFLQKDLGPALVLAVVFLVMYAVARGGAGLAAAGFAVLVAGFYAGYALNVSSTLVERVRMWRSPWDNAARGGDQIAQALWAMASGGALGSGGGLGDTRYVPAGHTDLVLAGIAEEFGFAGLLIVAAAFGALVWRALRIARRATTDYAFFLSLALTLFLLVPALLMLAGTLGLVPLTGVVTPFLSYGGSAMLANFLAIGLLASLASERQPSADLAPFDKGLRGVRLAASAAAAVLLAVAAGVQVVRADEIAVRPQLGLQADGSRRYQYNPRILDIARAIPRGTVVDRRGLPLATDDGAVLERAKAEYQRLGVSLAAACPDGSGRCYPLEGRAFHLLGDVRTRARWSASNTSFVERDAEARLRGFDDHQTPVATTDASGARAWTLRRDYRDLLPLLRRRYDRDHPDVKALLGRPREVRLTIDAALQLKTAAIVSAYARRTSGRAAAVVVDPATGDLLASVSYPWPAGDGGGSESTEETADDLFDRARYGIYPPGSTFKLVTAAAALQRDRAARGTTFVCERLPDGRVGARVAGWGRPVRDDVLDRHPHGAVDMSRAMTVSCNAYFAQLAVRLGPEALMDTARRVDIQLAGANTPARVRDALPQVGYGQGEVVATPMRMARIAAAVAGNGTVREVRWDAGAPAPKGEPFVSAEAARLIGSYMRDVVLSGTARALRGHPVAIAGKTGTAEVAGAASHAWFVGFAPYGAAPKRVAVAVIIEHAGYGGAAAAPAAGEIISAAAGLGLVR